MRRTQLKVETKWGEATITGRLGQAHQDVMDMIDSSTIAWKQDGDHLVAVIDPARLRSSLGWNKINYGQLIEKLEDLRKANLEIHDKRSRRVTRTSPILEISYGSEIQRDKQRQFSAQQNRVQEWIITISGSWLRLLEDARTSYSIEVCQLPHGESQALARFMLTHKVGARYHIPTILKTLGVTRMDKAWRRLLQDADQFKELGLMIEEEFIVRVQ